MADGLVVPDTPNGAPVSLTSGGAPGLFHLQQVFLEHYRICGLLAASAEAIGVPLRAVRRWQQQPAFAEALEDAEEFYRDVLRKEIHRRAVEGWDEPVYRGGLLAGYIRRFSDPLLIQLAKTRMPEFRDESVSGSVNVTAQTQVVLAWKEKPVPVDTLGDVGNGETIGGGSKPPEFGASG